MKIFVDKTEGAFRIGLACMVAALFLPFLACADSYGDRAVFNIDKHFDSAGRAQAPATLVWAGEKVYFYADDGWWNALDSSARAKYNIAFGNLDAEFSRYIRPKLVDLFGESTNLNFSRDGKLTILLHQMAKDAGGYINTGDGYSKYQAPTSNEREMIYFNVLFVDSPLAKAYLAHEYVHLITFNQKDRLRHVADDVWLNEARADYSSTILGYDVPFAGSNFDQRIRSFAADTGKSLTEWQNVPANYGAVHLLMQYIVDHYGINILVDSMKTDNTGIASIEYALRKNGFDVTFDQIFRDWLVALAVNDCRLGEKYCYKYADLKGFTISPKINYLPASDQVSLSVMYNVSYFAGNWQKIVGGAGDLRLDFSGDAQNKFIVPYLACDSAGKCDVGDLETAADGNAILRLEDFGRKYLSLTLMPFAAGKTFGFDDGNQSVLPYSFKISILSKTAADSNQAVIIDNDGEDSKIAAMLAQIEALKKEIARVQAILAARKTMAANTSACKAIAADLYLGARNYSQTVCLQEFLKSQGSLIYPGGIVNGNFDAATRVAVIRFQEKYASEILAPLGLTAGTGYVGSSTRAKINQLIQK